MTEILLSIDGPTAVLTLNAPERRNALNLEMAGALCEALSEVSRTPSVGALVVKANGDSFCAGADYSVLASVAKDPADDDGYELISRIYDSFYLLGQVGVPSIAAARGSCVGAGLNLLLAADLRVVATDIRLLSGFVSRGIHPGGGHMHLLARVAGREAAAAMAVFGQEIDGLRAAELGMVWEAREPDDVEARAMELAAAISTKPRLARKLVRSFREEADSMRLNWGAAKDLERHTQMWSMRNPQ